MNKTINQLDEIEGLATSDELAIWDNSASETKKVPASEIKSLVITATSTTVTGAKLMAGSVVKILFTSAITGSDTTTGMSISYNGTSYAVKVGKNGSLASFVASEIDSAYYYLQAYTTLELAFDGTQFIIIGNPVVISSADYTIYADGESVYNITKVNSLLASKYSATDGNLNLKIKYGNTLVNGSATIDLSSQYTNISCVVATPSAQNYNFIVMARVVNTNQIILTAKESGISATIECNWIAIGY